MEVNGTDDTSQLWQKVDEGGEDGTPDWARCFVAGGALIDTNDLASGVAIAGSQLSAAAGIVSGQILNGELVNADFNAGAAIAATKLNLAAAVLVGDLETNAMSKIVLLPTQVDISAADSELMNFHAVAALTITEIGLIWDGEATEGSGAAEGDVTIGTTSGGAQIVTAANGKYGVSQALGDYQALTIASGAMAAGTEMFVSHDIADSAAGKYRVQFKYDLDS